MKFALFSALIAAAATGVAAGVTPIRPPVVEAKPPTHVKRDIAASATDTALAAVGSINNGPFPLDLNGSNKTYDWPKHTFDFEVNGIPIQMAFMDVKPCCMPNGKTIFMMHGKNFCGITWRDQIAHFTDLGFRVIAPDNLGFCCSSKDPTLQYSLSQQVWAYKGLLNALGISSVIAMGHSYGGMMGYKFSFLYQDTVELFIATDPIGAEDYTSKGVTYAPIDAQYQQEASSDEASIHSYEDFFYYVNDFPPQAQEWVDMLVNIYHGSQRDNYINTQARTVDVVLTQPITPYIPLIPAPTLLCWGENDKTYIGAWDTSMANVLGQWHEFAPGVCQSMKNCTAHEFADYGHAPQVSDPPLYNQVTGDWIYGAMA